jgi:hypothetical protein
MQEKWKTKKLIGSEQSSQMYLINDVLAIGSILQTKPEMRYIDAVIGNNNDFNIVDVRMLSNSKPNPVQDYVLNMIRVISWLECGDKVVICSSTGQSRATAIALGVLIKYFKMSFNQGLEVINSKVPVADIGNLHILALKKLFRVS